MVAMADVLLSELDFDFVILGTGLTESILAAALAFAGARVLHLDSNSFYGSQSATLTLCSLKGLLKEEEPPVNGEFSSSVASLCTAQIQLPKGATVHRLNRKSFKSFVFPDGIHDFTASSSTQFSLSDDVHRKIHFDLEPKTLMAAGPMVDLLVKTRVGHYMDFRAFDASYVHFSSYGLRHVPASRSDIFQNRFITMMEKRLLMRFMKNALHTSSALTPSSVTSSDAEDDDKPTPGPSESTFDREMRLASLTDKLKTFLNHAVALSSSEAWETPALDALQAITDYQQSLMKFGTKTPFLYPNYGSAELSQAFCRMCAVQGGTYVLRRSVSAIVTVPDGDGSEEGSRVCGIVTDLNELVQCKAVFAAAGSFSDAPGEDAKIPSIKGDQRKIWRAICVVDDSLVKGEAQRVLLIIPKGAIGVGSATVRIRQLDSAIGVCPPGMYVVYAETVGDSGTANDLEMALNEYIDMSGGEDELKQGFDSGGLTPVLQNRNQSNDDETADVKNVPAEASLSCEADVKPKLLWGAMYSRDIQPGIPIATLPGSIGGFCFLGTGGSEPDAAFAIAEAKRCFEHFMPDAEFFGTEFDDHREEGSTDEPSAGENNT